MYTALVSNVLFPLHERLKRHTSAARRHDLERTQWFDRSRLEALRIERLRGFLTTVGRDVPYCRELFGKLAFDPSQVSSVADLQRLPLMTKATIRTHTEALKNERAARLVRYNTGGSSGEPLIFYMGMDRVSHDVAAKWRATRWWDVDIGDPEMVVWGSPIEVGAQDRVRQMRDRIMRSELLPAFEMSEVNLDQFVAAIKARRPRMLFGYPSALSHIARHAEKRGVKMDALGIRVAFVTSERLYEHQREDITRVFGCKVANGYGGRDAGFIAHDCPAGGMHISAEDIIVEIVDADGKVLPDGQAGEIVVTHLATQDFPFLRYRTGDVAAIGTTACSCGRGLPLLQALQGRTTDFVVAADGTVMHGLALIYVLRDLPGVQAFKIVQETRERTVVQVVAGPAFEPHLKADIVNGFKRRLGQAVEIDLLLVDHIPAEKSGKYRYVISHVATQGSGAERQAHA